MKKSYRTALAGTLMVLLFGMTAIAMGGPTTFTSDDFNTKNLKRPLWTLSDPRGDAKLLVSGTGTANAALSITVPAGLEHDLWATGDNVPKILQTATNTDFTLEAKFMTGVSGVTYQNYAAQGIIIKADATNMLRIDFTTGNEDSTKVFAAAFIGGFASPSVKIERNFASYGVSPLWLRVNRAGNVWTVSYSTNGSSFTAAGSFTQALTVSEVGVFVGNAGAQAKSTTTTIDYFMNNDAAISPEDGVANPADNLGPLVHNIQSLVAPNAFGVSWSTEEPSEGEFQYSQDLSFNLTYPVSGFETDLGATIPNLTPSTTYNYRIVSQDAAANSYTSATRSFTTGPLVLDGVSSSDDFNAGALDASLWTATNPRGDATISVAAHQLSIAVPGGISHDLYSDGNNVPRIMQSVSDNDFQVIAKFNSGVPVNGSSYSIQGILAQADTANLIRFDFSNDGTNTRLLSTVFANGLGSPATVLNTVVGSAAAAPIYLRLSRSGAQWLVDYSFNGTSWTSAGFFYHIMAVTKIGLFAGNAGASPAAFTMQADYFQAMLPAKPLVTAPANGAANVLLPVTVVWDTTSRATTYRLQVATDTTFNTIVYNDSTLIVPTRQVPALVNTTKYFARVRGKGQYGVGQYSKIVSFTTAPAAPGVPVLANPADAAVDVDTTISFRWLASAGTATYRLQVSTNAGFSSFAVNDSTIIDTVKAVGGLLTNTQYFWRVSAKNGGGTSAYSATRSFTTKSGIPAVPTLLAPVNAAVNQPTTMVFRWTKPTPPALTYRLQVASDSTFATGLVVNDSTVADTTRSVNGLANNVRYFWRVNAKSAGGTSAFSTRFVFTTILAAPAAPILASPANNAINLVNPVRLTWRRPADAATFHVQLGTDSTFASALVLNDSTLTDTTTVLGGLLFNTTYYWHVIARNVGGASPASALFRFKTLAADPTIPVQIAPLHGTGDLGTAVSVRWTRPAGASSFHIQIGTDSTFASGFVVNNPAAVDTFVNVSGLTFLTKYYWRVNADNIGGTSPYSPVWAFTVGIPLPAQVALVMPANAIEVSLDSVLLVWRKSSPLIDRYHLDLAVDSLFNFKTPPDSTLTDSSKVLRGLVNGQRYFWRVRGHNAGGWGAFSDARSFIATVVGIAQEPELPVAFALKQNYPNPFNPSTQIQFAVPKESRVRLEVYNLLGERVATLLDDHRVAGTYTVQFSATGLSSGLYLYRMTAGDFTYVRKMMFTK